MDDRPNVLIVGHSFISRLAHDLTAVNYLDPSFDLIQCNIQCYGVSGAKVATLIDHPGLDNVIRDFQPKIIILQIGGNDICDNDLKPEKLACNIIDLMAALQEKYALELIVVCELFLRYAPRNITPYQYEQKRNIVNQMLSIMLEDSRDVKFWKHLRLINSPLNINGHDGVHLSALGTKKFYRSIRLAVLHALDIINV